MTILVISLIYFEALSELMLHLQTLKITITFSPLKLYLC